MWWTRDNGTFKGRGIYGQTLHIDPARPLPSTLRPESRDIDRAEFRGAGGPQLAAVARDEGFTLQLECRRDVEQIKTSRQVLLRVNNRQVSGDRENHLPIDGGFNQPAGAPVLLNLSDESVPLCG